MPITCLQTADVIIPNAEFTYQTLEHRPVKPTWAVGSEDPIAVQEEDRVVLWWPDGLCQVYQCDGVLKEFWPKPTLGEVVASYEQAGYTRFHKDGSVEHIFDGKSYYWSKDICEGDASNGYEIQPMLYLCDESPHGWFMINGMKVPFPLGENSPLWRRSCDCTECYFEDRDYYRRSRWNERMKEISH
jgi:hypothetical protein